MKKTFAILLALVLLLSLAACGESDNRTEQTEAIASSEAAPTETTAAMTEFIEPTPEPDWEIAYTVDDFGDPTDDAYMRSNYFYGTFSNTAVKDADLSVILFYVPYYRDSSMITLNSEGHISRTDGRALSCMYFRLLEYGKNNAVYSSYDDITLKMKIGEDTYSTALYGDAPNGDLSCLYLFNDTNEGRMMDKMVGAFYNGEDVRCIIEIGSSKYSFTIHGNNYKETENELMQLYGIVPY